jgi:hypothetical protein
VRYLAILFLIALLLACGTSSGARETTIPALTPAAAPAPLTAVPVTLATGVPTAEPATSAPEPTAKPAVAPTRVPLPTQAGAAPKGSDCPADHPVKGNIRDRDPDKGARIYHIPGSPSYAATKPERCFVDAKEAEAAGFRAPK